AVSEIKRTVTEGGFSARVLTSCKGGVTSRYPPVPAPPEETGWRLHMPVPPPYRVIQWATGAVGRSALRSVLTRPEFELAGVLVYDPDKIGVDAGELVGLSPTGVRCTDDAERVLALDADCVLHMPLPASYFGGSDVETI